MGKLITKEMIENATEEVDDLIIIILIKQKLSYNLQPASISLVLRGLFFVKQLKYFKIIFLIFTVDLKICGMLW